MYKEKNGNFLENINEKTYFLHCTSIENLKKINQEANYEIGKYFRTKGHAFFIVKNKNEDKLKNHEIIEECINSLYMDILKFRNYFNYDEIRFQTSIFKIDQINWCDLEFIMNRLGFILNDFGINVTAYTQ